MAVKLNSYIMFNGNAKEAIEFYKSVFGGEVYSDTYGSFADKMPSDPADADKIMHAYLKGDNGIELMVSDVATGMEFPTGAQIQLTLNGDDETILRGYWDKLVEGGNVALPLEEAPWGDKFGVLIDKFGINWMVDIGPVQG